MDSYIQYGLGPHTCLGEEASKVALTAMLRVVGRLENLRRAPGAQGQLKKVPRAGGFYVYMKEDYTTYFPFPMSELPLVRCSWICSIGRWLTDWFLAQLSRYTMTVRFPRRSAGCRKVCNSFGM